LGKRQRKLINNNMARYNNEDQRNLEELLEEGFMDRFKARGAQALGAVKGAGQQLKGKAQQAAGGMVQKAGNLAAKGVEAVGGQIDPSQNKLTQAGQGMQQTGQSNVQAGSVRGEVAKIDSYKNSAQKNIQNLVADIQNDLTKLGVQVDTKKMQQFSKSMTTSLLKALDIFKGQVGQTTGATPPPLPQQQAGNDPYSRMRARSAAPEAEEDYY
jgi:hypothetical protein